MYPRWEARLERWWRHRHWHATQPEYYWRTVGQPENPDDFIRCPFCHKEYRNGSSIPESRRPAE